MNQRDKPTIVARFDIGDDVQDDDAVRYKIGSFPISIYYSRLLLARLFHPGRLFIFSLLSILF